jgi:peptidylprolyl isomerase
MVVTSGQKITISLKLGQFSWLSRRTKAVNQTIFLTLNDSSPFSRALFIFFPKEFIMQKVESGLFVSIDYTGTLDNGEVFDSSEGRQPLEVQMGSGSVIPGFESALMGMSLNEAKTFTLSPQEAYGERDPSRMHNFPRADVPEGMTPEVGQTLMLSTPQGQEIPARVDSIDDDNVVFDLNHPLAGKSLTFDIKVVEISEAPIQQQAGCGCDCSSGGCGDGGCG